MDLNRHLPRRWSSWELTVPGGVTFDRRGGMILCAMLQQVKPDEERWGHPSNEVVRFRSGDGGKTFQFGLLGQPDRNVAHWLPNLERSTGHNAVPDSPGIIYTAGPPGGKNTELLANRVYWSS